MRVTRESYNAKSVEELLTGECFLWRDKLFIVTGTGDGRRYVRLDTGMIYSILESELVTLVDAEVIVHD